MKWLDTLKEFLGIFRPSRYHVDHYKDLIAPTEQPLYRVITPYKIQTIRIERVLHKEEVDVIGEEGIRDLFAREVAEYLKEHGLIDIYLDSCGFQGPYGCRYIGELKVAVSKDCVGKEE